MVEPLLGKTLAELQDVAQSLGLPRFTAKQMMQWLYQKHVSSIDEMTNLSKQARALLSERFVVSAGGPAQVQTSSDGTEKYLFPTLDGKYIETVYIPESDRATLCVSTQVGCKMNCLFCQTGKQGFQGNLTAADILGQVSWAMREKGISNIVVMGQGEPLDNIDNLLRALSLLTSPDAYAWSPHRITVSTVGLRKTFARLLEECECHVAVSLHSPIHEQRAQLMPAEGQFPIAEVVDALRNYDFSHQRRLSFEYIVLHGMNDTPLHQRELVKLLGGLHCRVNLIRWHRIPSVDLPGSDEAAMLNLRNYLTKHGIFTTIRQSRGEDIMAACGMLNSKQNNQQ